MPRKFPDLWDKMRKSYDIIATSSYTELVVGGSDLQTYIDSFEDVCCLFMGGRSFGKS